MERLKKSAVINGIAEKVEGVTKRDVERVYSATFEFIAEQLAAGNAVPIFEFGTFSPAERKERMGRNPTTNEEVVIPGRTVPVFKATATLKNRVAGK